MTPLESAVHALRSGDDLGAYHALRALIAGQPVNAEAQRLLGVACRRLNFEAEAETAFKAAIRVAKKDPANHAEYGAFLHSTGREAEAEKAYRAALALDRRHPFAAAGLATLLTAEKRFAEALQATTPAVARGDAPAALRHVHAGALRELNHFGEAEALLTAVIAERPFDDGAQVDLAELIWMRTGDAAAAAAHIDQALAARPDAPRLVLAKARVLTQAGDAPAARAFLDEALTRQPNDPTLLAARGRLGGEGQVGLLEQAANAQPYNLDLKVMLAQALLETGDPARASAMIAQVLVHAPNDQLSLALQATAWRELSDPRYGQLYDYDALVQISDIATPKGWPTLTAYLADLAEGLHALHTVRAHPFGQSVKGGSQVALAGARHPAVAAFEKAIEPPIRQAVERLKASGHPTGARATDSWRYTGMWSVRLRAQGYHDNHIHNEGWLSSACYIELPPLPGHEGWFKLGQPGLKLPTPLPPDRWIEPAPGRLILFPSYMWHGVEPFTSDKPRLTCAFDLAPV